MKIQLLMSVSAVLIGHNFLVQSTLALQPDNPHYFVRKDKPTVPLTSGEYVVPSGALGYTIDLALTINKP